MMNDNNFANEYEIEISAQQPDTLQITDISTGNTLHLTFQEAANLLVLMYRHRDELRALRTGEAL